MKLTGKQLKQLHDALLNAFGRGDLQRMVRFELDEKRTTGKSRAARTAPRL